jgi:serine/threonine protein kinase
MLEIKNGQQIGHWEVVDFLGRGAFAQVFLAVDSAGNHAALKVGDESGGGSFVPRFGEVTGERDPARVSPDETPAEALFLDPAEGARPEVLDAHEVDELLLAESELLEAGCGRGIPTLREVAEKEGRPVLVMDAVDGSTLRNRIRNQEGVKLGWLLETARTLERLNRLGWECHGDVKPENILVTPTEKVVLIDPAPATGRPDEVVATPWYNPFLRRDSKGDAQGLAIILYELLCGAMPFDKVPFHWAGIECQPIDEESRDLDHSLFLAYPRPRELNPKAPREIERMIYLTLCDEAYGLPDFRMDLEDFLLKS